jgi:hypothetical protein
MLKLTGVVFILLVLLSSNTLIFAQDGGEQAAEMQVWMDYMTPGAMHQMLAGQVGDWKTISRYWMDPSAEPMTYEGFAKTEMILGGRYQKSKHNAEVMGMPMEGISIMGFDNVTQEFSAIWIDNLGTGTAVAKGKYNESTKTISMDGSMIDPMSKSEMKFKQYFVLTDDDHFTLIMNLDIGGQEFKSMEIEFVRQ